MREEMFAKYERVGALSDRAGYEFDRRTRAVEIARAIGAEEVTLDALRLLRRQAERRFWRLCKRRHAAFDAWNVARKAGEK